MRNSRKLLHGVRVLLPAVFLIFALAFPAFAEEAAEAPGGQAESSEPAYPDASIIQSNGTEGWPKLYDMASDYFCVMDADTGVILAEKGMDTETPPASLTKILTTMLALENGDLDAEVTMTSTGVSYAVGGSSNLYTQVGEKFVLRDMLYGVMLKSANDMATQVGEFIGGGSLDRFLEMMNARAAELGCRHSYFANSCGMPNEAHHSSAHDLALISKEALKNPMFREIVHTKEYTIPATNMNEARIFQNHHKFLVTSEYAYDGIIGGKTGYTDLAGSCLATYVERDGRTVIVIALHCLGMDNCLLDTRELCDYGLEEFENVSVTSDDGSAPTGLITLPKGHSLTECTTEETKETLQDGSVKTTVSYSFGGRPVGTLTGVTAPPAETEAAAAEEEADAPEDAQAEADAANAAGNEEKRSSAEVTRASSGGLVKIFGILIAALLLLILILFVVNVRLQRKRKREAHLRQREQDRKGRRR